MTIVKRFLHSDSSAGILLIIAGSLALICSNSPLAMWYEQLLHLHLSVQLGTLGLDQSLLHWVNDGLMALFFLLVGLEIKREVLEGSLSNPSAVVLPCLGALGGVLVPALIFYSLNSTDTDAIRGWAIPTATDIAFALGILSLLGDKVPKGLRLLLMTIAIVDDLVAVCIIAIFYSTDLSILALSLASISIVILIILNFLKVRSLAAYGIVGLFLWVCVLQSGVHATLSGIVIAFTIPLRVNHHRSPAHALEHSLHKWVNFLILPLFAFANAGVYILGMSLADIIAPVPLGIALGLFLGKQLGIFTAFFIVIKLGFAKLPHGVCWRSLYGMTILCGIGFTMSLFIGSLAFDMHTSQYVGADKLGVILGSLLSGLFGSLILHNALNRSTDS